MHKNRRLLLIMFGLSIALLCWVTGVRAQGDVPPDSPVAGSSPLPTPMPTPVRIYSPEIELALTYIADREGIPRADLVSLYQEEVTFPTLGRSYLYVTANVNTPVSTPDDFRIFQVLVDPETMTIEPDFNAVRAAEDAAYRAKYGKLDPSLYDLLQKVHDDTVLPVGIWVVDSSATPSQESIEEEIIARYPEAREALAQKGTLWAVEDPQLAIEIQVAYEQLLAAAVATRTQPLRTWLEEQGFTVQETPGIIPSLAADLPKWAIIVVSERADVAQVYDISQKAMPAADLTPIDQASYEWGVNLREFLW